MKIHEISRFLGVSPDTVGRRLRNSLSLLKEEVIGMMEGDKEGYELPATFTFNIVEMVKKIRIHPISPEKVLPWGLSIAACIIIAVMGLGNQLNLSKSISMDMDHFIETTASDEVIVPVDVLEGFQMSTDNHSRDFDTQNAYLLSEEGNISGKTERASMAPFQQDNKNVDLVWRDLVGAAADVSVVGNHAFLCAGYSLVVLDMKDANKPTQVGYLELPDRATGIHISENYAYIAAFQNGVRIVDISNPDTPKEVGSCDISGYIYDIFADGNYAYATDYNGKLYVIDISDPENPKKTGECDIQGQGVRIHVANGFAFVAAGGSHLRIIDVSDPEKPWEVSFCNTPKGARDVFINDSYAYVAGGEAGLRVIDISDPQNPDEVGFYDSPGYATGIYVFGTHAYLADYLDGFYILDISNPKSPKESGNCNPSGYESKVYVADNKAYVTDFNAGGLQVIDVSDVINPREMGFYDTPGTAWGIYADKGYAYVAEGNGGIRILDVSDPNSPKARGTWDSPGYARKIHVVDNYAYVADLGFYIVDVSDPDNPKEAGRYMTQGALYGVHVVENYAYVTDAVRGLSIMDVSDPKKPAEVAVFKIPGVTSAGVYVKDKYAYMACFRNGLYVIDVSHPKTPRKVGFCSVPNAQFSIHVINDFAYIPDYETGLYIINVSDPRNPKFISSFEAGGATAVQVDNNYAYLAAGDLYVIDVSNPKNPKEAGFYDTRSFIEDLCFADGLVYTAGGNGGLCILKPNISGMPVEKTGKLPGTWGETKKTALLQNYPNPFNPETWIPYQLSEDTDVNINIYDVSGNIVRTLGLGHKQKGSYISKDKAVYWGGRSDGGERMASGVYYYTIQAGEYRATRKMVLAQ